MKRKIELAPGLSLPADAATETFAILARKDGGKTYAGLKAFEEMHACGAQCVAIDPVGKWWALRLAADGKRPGIDVPIFGGPRADLPLEPTAGALIARVIVERGISAVIDVSLFEDREMKRFVTDFARELYKLKQRKQSVMHLFVEEASTFMPQDKEDGSDPPMLNAFKKIVRKGRNYGIGVTLIDQRAQDVNKKVLNQTSILIVLGTSGTTDRTAIEKWVRDKHIDASGLDELASLEQGDAFVWLPREKTFKRVHIGKRWTFDASATPKLGRRQRVVKKLTPTDVSALRDAIGESVKRAEENDPEALRKTVHDLERRLKLAEGNATALAKLDASRKPVGKTKTIEKPILKESHVKRLEAAFARSTNARQGAAEKIARADAQLKASVDALHVMFAKTEAAMRAQSNGVVRALPGRAIAGLVMPQPTRHAAARPLVERAAKARGETIDGAPRSLVGKSVDMLRVLAQRTLAGKGTTRTQLALLVGLSPRTGTYGNYLSALNTRGFMESSRGGELFATREGTVEVGDNVAPLPTGAQLVETWRRQLVGKASDMLRVLVDTPDGLTREELAAAVGLSPRTGTYGNYLSKLNSTSLMEKRNGRLYAAAEFSEGVN